MNAQSYNPPESVVHSDGVYWFVQQRGDKWRLLYRNGNGPLTEQHTYWTREAAIAAAYRYASY